MHAVGGVSELNIGGEWREGEEDCPDILLSGWYIVENSSLFAVLRVGNSEFRTDVVHTCANVIWNKTFYL